MVDRSYLVGKACPPGPARLYVDQHLTPAAIDLAGGIEAAIERLAVQVRKSPSLAVGLAIGLGLALSLLPRRSA